MTMTAPASVTPRPLRRLHRAGLGDELLAGRAATGDDTAFTTLYERYYGPLLGYTRSILLDGEDARDATQNALESALRALPARDASRPLRPWLYKIAHNEAITIVRRRRPQSELVEALEPPVPGPEFDAEQRGRLAQLVDDLRTLPERQRGALVMRELNGLSYDEIGLALGLSNEAARRAVFDARNALHDAVDGRATPCASVRHSISDGDRRSLRARGIRAHLRSCDDCASFQRSIAARRADLHAFAPWVSGAAVLGALGGGVGGGALLAGGGASAAGGAGLSWGGLPVAVKGLAVAAAVAGTGTAAVEIERVAAPDRPAAKSRPAPPQRSALSSPTPRATATPKPARRLPRKAATGAGASSPAIAREAPGDTAALLAPDAPGANKPAAALKPRSPAASPPAAAAPQRTAEELAKARLARLTEQLRRVIADAQALAAGGTQSALSLARSMLQRTVVPLLQSIDRVLAPFGLRLPSSPTATTSGATGLSNLLAPVRGILDRVRQMLQRLFSRG